ncbi:hypothetical protein BRD02_03950 [Halobacteriales archaeon QS_8_69_73]|nr:MAG: hypothetical protein BRD02_03950 [Halobacteriales archaeon QS_8_69_73]
MTVPPGRVPGDAAHRGGRDRAGGLVRLNGDLRPAVAVTAATALVMSVALGPAPARLAFRLETFAGQVPGEPEATVAWAVVAPLVGPGYVRRRDLL